MLLGRARSVHRGLLLPALLNRSDAVPRGDDVGSRGVVEFLLLCMPDRVLLPRRRDRAGVLFKLHVPDDGALLAAAHFVLADCNFVGDGNGDGDRFCDDDGHTVRDGYIYVNRLRVSDSDIVGICYGLRICISNGHGDDKHVRYGDTVVDNVLDELCIELGDVDSDCVSNIDRIEFAFRNSDEFCDGLDLLDPLRVSIRVHFTERRGVCIVRPDGVVNRIRFAEWRRDRVGARLPLAPFVPLDRILIDSV